MYEENKKLKIKASELQLGDVICLFPEMAFSSCVVKKIEKEKITLFRPYGVSSDFSYTGGVICYTGIEEFSIFPTTEVFLLERKQVK